MKGLGRRACLLALAFMFSSLLLGCWKQSSLAVQEEGSSYLRLNGDLTNVVLVLDGGEGLPLLDSRGKTSASSTLWEVLPGRHLVELHRNSALVLRRDLFVGQGQVVEVSVPR